jgi:peptide chain release factor
MKNIILHITAGQGPKECQWVVLKLADVFGKEANKLGLECELLERPDEAVSSLLLSVSGKGCEAFAAERTGSIRWIGESPFRPKHKRKNWYVGVKPMPNADDVPDLKDQDIKYQAIRASGPGGQHVNKTDSAVRATHIPTGITSVSQDQRSQFANKKIARLKLALIVEEQRELAANKSKADVWQQNRELERGNEVRCYEGVKFRRR